MATDVQPRPGYAPQLDGLRAVSVAAVAYSHWLPQYQAGLPLGAGVHLFFVLSGFLITRILLGVRGERRRLGATGRFYLRRALRLFPAFYVVLGAAWLADVPLVRETWPWHAAYLSNAYIASEAAWQGHLSHFWSLAVEEQYYLLWPWLVVWLPQRLLGPLFAATALLGPAARAVASAQGLTEPFWALVPAGSADSLALGALIAWGRSRDPEAFRGPGWRAAVWGTAAAWIALALVERNGVFLPPAVTIWRQVLQGVVFAAMVATAVDGFGGAAGRLLGARPMVAVGRISYGLYLIHAFAPIVVDAGWRAMTGDGTAGWTPAARAAAAAVTTLALAAALWTVVEAPVHRLKARV